MDEKEKLIANISTWLRVIITLVLVAFMEQVFSFTLK